MGYFLNRVKALLGFRRRVDASNGAFRVGAGETVCLTVTVDSLVATARRIGAVPNVLSLETSNGEVYDTALPQGMIEEAERILREEGQ